MKRLLVGTVLGIVGAAAYADPCAGRLAAGIVAYDRPAREALGLVVNQCGRAVQAEVLVVARNRDGYPIAWIQTSVIVPDAAPLSVVRIALPFVSAAVAVSDYVAEVKSSIALDEAPGQLAGGAAEPFASRDPPALAVRP